MQAAVYSGVGKPPPRYDPSGEIIIEEDPNEAPRHFPSYPEPVPEADSEQEE